MTLILGMNLSDRIYIAGDTRVTFKDGSYSDNVIKVVPLTGLSLLSEKPILQKDVIVSAAIGDLQTANYLFKKMQHGIRSGVLSTDIRIFYEQIKSFMLEEYKERIIQGNNQAQAGFVFGGITSKRKKIIDLNVINCLIKELDRKFDEEKAERMEAKRKALSQPAFQAFVHAFGKDKALQSFDMPNKYQINPILKEAIEKNSNELNCNDSFVCSVLIKDDGVHLEKAEWGELLAYGTNGITKETISSAFLARSELFVGAWIKGSNSTEVSALRDQIMYIADKLGIKQIGGIVTPFILRDNGYLPAFFHRKKELTGKVLEDVGINEKGPYFQKGDSEIVQLIEFKDYLVNSKASL